MNKLSMPQQPFVRRSEISKEHKELHEKYQSWPRKEIKTGTVYRKPGFVVHISGD